MPVCALELILEGDPAGGWIVRSPAVGVWVAFPEAGAALEDGSAGVLIQAGKRFHLRLPDNGSGIVRDLRAGKRKALDVEWGQELFRLSGDAPRDGASAEGPAAAPADVLVAPTDGVFYTRPKPGEPPFVGPGDSLDRGRPVGLIEVMKTFNHVLFEGHALPHAARVVELLVDDGTEVRAGQPILRYEPS